MRTLTNPDEKIHVNSISNSNSNFIDTMENNHFPTLTNSNLSYTIKKLKLKLQNQIEFHQLIERNHNHDHDHDHNQHSNSSILHSSSPTHQHVQINFSTNSSTNSSAHANSNSAAAATGDLTHTPQNSITHGYYSCKQNSYICVQFNHQSLFHCLDLYKIALIEV
jgi:hypothetical protein